MLPRTRKLNLLVSFLAALLLGSCVQRPFVPGNIGRENGNPTTPWMVSHLPEKNHWALARTKHHNIFQRILCFDYKCRKMIGRRKVLRAISYSDYKKRIAKNAKKGIYKKTIPAAPVIIKQKQDTLPVVKKPIRIVPSKPVLTLVAPILKADSLITLSDLLFETNSYKLKGKHFSQLDSLSKFLLAHPRLEITVLGHTDNTGNELHNVTLSTHRAEVVAQYLINLGLPDEKVFFEGFGSSRPIRGNETQEDRGKNRRVEILIRESKKNSD